MLRPAVGGDVQLTDSADRCLAGGEKRQALPRRGEQRARQHRGLLGRAIHRDEESSVVFRRVAALRTIRPFAVRERLRHRRLEIVVAVGLQRRRDGMPVGGHDGVRLRSAPSVGVLEIDCPCAAAGRHRLRPGTVPAEDKGARLRRRRVGASGEGEGGESEEADSHSQSLRLTKRYCGVRSDTRCVVLSVIETNPQIAICGVKVSISNRSRFGVSVMGA